MLSNYAVYCTMIQRAGLCCGPAAVQSQQGPVDAGAHDNMVVVGAVFMSMLATETHSRL